MLTLPPSKDGERQTRRRFNQKVKTLPADVVWQGRPSIILAIGKLNKLFLTIIVMLIVGWKTNWTYPTWLIAASLGIGAYSVLTWLAKVVTILCISYTITYERLLYRRGVFNQVTDELEFFRVCDFQVQKPLNLRILGLGNVVLITSDRTHPVVTLSAIPETEKLHATIRDLVRRCWQARGVYEVDAG